MVPHQGTDKSLVYAKTNTADKKFLEHFFRRSRGIADKLWRTRPQTLLCRKTSHAANSKSIKSINCRKDDQLVSSA